MYSFKLILSIIPPLLAPLTINLPSSKSIYYFLLQLNGESKLNSSELNFSLELIKPYASFILEINNS